MNNLGIKFNENDIDRIESWDDFLEFAYEYLNWQVRDIYDTFEWDTESIDLPEEIGNKINGRFAQIRPFRMDAPIKIFLLDFPNSNKSIPKSTLRIILRNLMSQKKNELYLDFQNINQILFICKTGKNEFVFAQWQGESPYTAKLTTFGWEPNEPKRTLLEYNLQNLVYDSSLNDEKWIELWNGAFDVQKVTKKFFDEFYAVFEKVKKLVEGIKDDEILQLFTIRLFNRLMFLRFVEKKGWLRINDKQDYLKSLFDDYKNSNDDNFYDDRLKILFFNGLSNPDSRNLLNIKKGGIFNSIGQVPFLNGGLFEKQEYEEENNISIPDEVFELIFDNLIYRYNFTITESTPLDIDMSIDPEMLGKVFEELITQRHDTGSYYTPKIVVSFMCREAIKGYLEKNTKEQPDAIKMLVEKHDGTDIANPENLLEKLKKITVCDPACGSGAYLVGMMHELLDIRKALWATRKVDPNTQHKRKLEIIAHNLYGVDIHKFAVDIAKLRLWLSLIVDETRHPLDDDDNPDVSLPNLDFKIETGDSLIAPSPENIDDLFREALAKNAVEIAKLKDDMLLAKLPEDKKKLRTDIDNIEKKLTALQPGHHIPESAFDWKIKFAEVFANEGFDVVIANPPYVRQEEISKNLGAKYKASLLKQYKDAAVGRSDLYVYFYARGVELLKNNGYHVFVCSNSWLDVGYGGKLQEYLLKKTNIKAVYDSAVERQFSTASVNTIISIIRKAKPEPEDTAKFILLKDAFETAIQDDGKKKIRQITYKDIINNGTDNDKNEYIGDKWGGKYLRAPDIYWKILDKAGDKLKKLDDIAVVKRGVTTGANDFFYLEPTGKNAPKGFMHVKNKAGWEGLIEEEYLKPVIKSPREIDKILIELSKLKYLILICNKSKTALSKSKVLKYIEWGESKGYNTRTTCSSRKYWWSLSNGKAPEIILPCGISSVYKIYKNAGVYIDKRLYEVYSIKSSPLHLLLNSTITPFFLEILSSSNLGDGLLDLTVVEYKNVYVFTPEIFSINSLKYINCFLNRPIKSIFEELGLPKPNRDLSNIDSSAITLDGVMADRRELDKVVFESIGLTEVEQLEVYRATVDLVKNRLVKAKSK